MISTGAAETVNVEVMMISLESAVALSGIITEISNVPTDETFNVFAVESNTPSPVTSFTEYE